ncbi:hypothetical protein [Streptomyces cyaneus]|uniref:hypothetical protein n=1 Tax=Streptomyces cyaneus TaxID=1904 RepID=UPI001FE70C09|nr:hypothetical protein [Streptomyces cyaneus]
MGGVEGQGGEAVLGQSPGQRQAIAEERDIRLHVSSRLLRLPQGNTEYRWH